MTRANCLRAYLFLPLPTDWTKLGYQSFKALQKKFPTLWATKSKKKPVVNGLFVGAQLDALGI
jgi:hypothetical protein